MAAGVKHTSVDKGEGRIRELIAEMKRTPRGPHVKAGVLEGAGDEESGVPVIAVAVWNEFGTSRIPERAALRTAAAKLIPVMTALGAKLLGKIVDGSITVDKALDELGTTAQTAMRKSIAGWTTPDDAPATVAAKGFDKPLEDSGTYADSITYEKVR